MNKPHPARRWLWPVVMATAVIGLMAHVPAWTLLRAATQQAAKANTPLPVQILGLEGPWSNATAAAVVRNDRSLLQNLNLRFTPSSLLLARLGFDATAEDQDLRLNGHISRSLRALRLNEVRVEGRIKRVAALGGWGFVPLDGTAELRVHELVLINQFPDHADGELWLKNLAWTLAAKPMPLGDFKAEIRTKPDAIVADITSPSGPLEAKGKARLFPDKRYELDLQLRPKPGAGEMLNNYLRSLGQPDAQGYTRIRKQGRLP